MTDFDPYPQGGSPIEGRGRVPRSRRRRRRERGRPTAAPPARPATLLVDPGAFVDAGFGRRLGAFVLDCLIFVIPVSSLSSFVEAALPKERASCKNEWDISVPCDVLTKGSEDVYVLWLLVVLLFIVIFYFGHLEGRRGGTPGKRIAGLRVVRADTGGPIGMGRAIGRFLLRFVSAAPFFLGYFWMLWDDDNQTWHDKVVRSRVVRS